MSAKQLGQNLWWIGALLLFSTAGCRQPSEKAPAPPEIARVGSVSISPEAFEHLLQMRAAGAPERYATLAAKEALLDELIRKEAVFAKAKAVGFDQRADIQESVRRMIASKFEEEQRKARKSDLPPVAPQEIEQYYKEHAGKYAVPAQARGAIIFIKIASHADPDNRAQDMARAQELLEQAKAASDRDFAVLAQKNSDDQVTRYRAGDIGWITPNAKTSALEPAVTEALFALQKPGDFAPLVSTAKGVYIVKLVATRPADIRPLAEVRDAIAYALQWKHREQNDKDFYEAMETGLQISINRPLLDSIQPPKAPARVPPNTPGPMTAQNK